jgi:hypothetical protein
MHFVEFQESLKNLLLPNVASELDFGMYKLLILVKFENFQKELWERTGRL